MSTAAAFGNPPAADTTILVRGVELLRAERFDEAREDLIRSSQSDNPRIRAESFLYLNALEMQLENYDEALVYLKRYHTQALEFYEAALHEGQRIKKRHNWLILGLMLVISVLVTGAVFFMHKKIALLRKISAPAGTEKSTSDGPRYTDISDWERYRVDAAKFRETAIYSEITELTGQPRGRGARVMSLVKQEALDRELAVGFAHFAVRLQSEYPSLTSGDVKLCCLSLAGLSHYAQALCFGSTETNIIRQRKYKIKRKMELDTNGTPDPRGVALFEYIFGVGTPPPAPTCRDRG